MSTFSKKQNKKTLGIENLKGVTVMNIPCGKKFGVKFKAETRRNSNHFYGGISDTAHEAAKKANVMFAELYHGKRAAQKAGYWNLV